MTGPDTSREPVLQRLVVALTILVVMATTAGLLVPLSDGQVRSEPRTTTPQPVTSLDRDAAKRLYVRVMQEFRKKDYEAALAGFRFFMALHASSHLVPSAHYWAGECAYRLGRYEDAIQAFSQVVQVSDQTPKRASATLKMGLAYRKLGQADQSRILFQRLVTEYPDSPEVELARKYLDRERPDPAPVSR